MLRLPKFSLEKPRTVAAALELLESHGERAMILAGGTDLVPNLKHQLFEPECLVALGDIEELHGVTTLPDGSLRIGAMTPLDELAAHADVIARAPALAQAAGLVAGPQLRRMGTLGGNVMLDTRCQWYNQTYFWRKSLGFCLKKDGTECHVVAGGRKCVAAASNDTAAPLMGLDAVLELRSAAGSREVAIADFWLADGIFNKKLQSGELLVAVRVPATPAGHRGAYGKLRDRGSIDFPLFGAAVRLDVEDGVVTRGDVHVTALQARPLAIKKAPGLLVGARLDEPKLEGFRDVADAVAKAAHAQCHPMPNIPGDHDYRRRMVPVYVRRTLMAAAQGTGPVHHV